jgi:hypothetical protein
MQDADGRISDLLYSVSNLSEKVKTGKKLVTCFTSIFNVKRLSVALSLHNVEGRIFGKS